MEKVKLTNEAGAEKEVMLSAAEDCINIGWFPADADSEAAILEFMGVLPEEEEESDDEPNEDGTDGEDEAEDQKKNEEADEDEDSGKPDEADEEAENQE